MEVPASALDHGGLGGLADDDHTHYFLADGTRVMTGDIDLNGNDLDLGPGGGIIEDGSAVGDILEHNGTKYVEAEHHPTYQGRASSQTWDGTTRYLDWDTDDQKETGFTHSTSSTPSQVTVDFDGAVEIDMTIGGSFTVVGVLQAAVQVDTGGGFATITGTTVWGTSSTAGGRESVSLAGYHYDVSNGDKFRVAYQRFGAGSGTTIADESHLKISKVRSA